MRAIELRTGNPSLGRLLISHGACEGDDGFWTKQATGRGGDSIRTWQEARAPGTWSIRSHFDQPASLRLAVWTVLLALNEVLLKSDGSAWRPLVHVEDMGRAFIAALEADRHAIHRQIFNVGRNSDCMRIRELAAIVGKAVPNARIRFAKEHISDTRTYRVDCSKIKKIGFEPRRNIMEAVCEMADAFRRTGISIEEFEGDTEQTDDITVLALQRT